MKLIKMNKRSDVGVNSTRLPCEANCSNTGWVMPPNFSIALQDERERQMHVWNNSGHVPYSIEDPKNNI